MKLGRWSWGYIPVAVVLGLIWYEFWQSGAFSPAPGDNSPADTQAAATSIAPPGGGPVGAPVAEANPRPTERPTQPPPVGARPPEGPARMTNTALKSNSGSVIDDVFLNSPPPISVSFSNVPLDTAVDYLRQALGPNAAIQVSVANLNPNQRFSVDVKNASFWDAFKAMSRQSPLDLVAGSNYGKDGLVLNYGVGVYRVLTNGPAILIPRSITYIRQNNGQDALDAVAAPRYSLFLGAAVDPRIRVTRISPLEATEIVNEAGQRLALSRLQTQYSSQPSNYWDSSVEIDAAAPAGKTVTIKCLLRFTAQLTENTAVIEDATHKVGNSFMLGDRGLRLVRFDVTGSQVLMQLQLDTPTPPIPIYYTITDANGRSMNFQTQSNQMRSASIDTMRPPFKLTLHAPDQTRDMSLPFELKDIPLP